ncbi:neurogenic locus notch-like, partial [Tropilaelaps mercedesae]
ENFTSVAVKELDVPESSFALPTCRPNPCFNGGRCLEESGRNVCKCLSTFNGVLCHLSPCDSGFCHRGECRMNENTRMPECLCEAGYIGERCGQRRSPCEHNPCGPHGTCRVARNRLDYECVCHYAYDGRHCERQVQIVRTPLSARMVKEPFWLGLITVGTVLLIILMVYCVKRKFADKIEKFLADEIERSKNSEYQGGRITNRPGFIGLLPVQTELTPPLNDKSVVSQTLDIPSL